MSPTTRPARTSQPTSRAPQVPRSGEHVADTSCAPPRSLSWTRATATAALPGAESPSAPRGVRPRACGTTCVRDHGLLPLPQACATVPAGSSSRSPAWRPPEPRWRAAGCGSQPTADPPQEGRLASPAPSAGGGKRAGPVLSVARGGGPADITAAAVAALGGMEAFVRPGADVIVKPNICTGYHGAGVRRDHQSRGRRRAGLPVPPRQGRPRAGHGPAVRRPGRRGLPGERHPDGRGAGRRGDADHVAHGLPRVPHPRRPRPRIVADLRGRALVRRPHRRAHRQGPRRPRA